MEVKVLRCLHMPASHEWLISKIVAPGLCKELFVLQALYSQQTSTVKRGYLDHFLSIFMYYSLTKSAAEILYIAVCAGR